MVFNVLVFFSLQNRQLTSNVANTGPGWSERKYSKNFKNASFWDCITNARSGECVMTLSHSFFFMLYKYTLSHAFFFDCVIRKNPSLYDLISLFNQYRLSLDTAIQFFVCITMGG